MGLDEQLKMLRANGVRSAEFVFVAAVGREILSRVEFETLAPEAPTQSLAPDDNIEKDPFYQAALNLAGAKADSGDQ